MKILAISTSPRASGNTDLLVDRIVSGAARAGAEVEKLSTRDLAIAPCIECGACRKTGHCVVKDDMQRVYPRLFDADRIVFATPVYFLGPCAQAKAVIDRCQALWSRKFVLKLPVLNGDFPHGRRGYLVSVAGTRGKRVFECVQRILKNVFEVLEVEYGGELLYRQIDEKGAILAHPTAMKDAEEFGQRIAQQDV